MYIVIMFLSRDKYFYQLVFFCIFIRIRAILYLASMLAFLALN